MVAGAWKEMGWEVQASMPAIQERLCRKVTEGLTTKAGERAEEWENRLAAQLRKAGITEIRAVT